VEDNAQRRGAGPLRAFADSNPEADDPGTAGYDDVLRSVHVPTARVVRQLRQARHKLLGSASPELQLAAAIRALLRTERRLARPLRVAICGEFNSGKSTLANLLAGIESLPTAVTSNTLIPTLLHHADEPEVWAVDESGRRQRLRGNCSLPREAIFRVDVGLPSPHLRAMQILDLPGLVASRSGGPIVDLAAHHVDATIWCTVSTQAWKESERSARSMLAPRLQARGLLVVTHGDLLNGADREKLMARLYEDVGSSVTSIVLLATLEAIGVMRRAEKSQAAWAATGAVALDAALDTLLTGVRDERAAAALSVTGRIAQRSLGRIESRFDAAR
jgi:hypothetical protein